MLPSAAELGFFARITARRGALIAAGGLLVAVGTGFVLAAIWTLIAQVYGPVAASLGVGGLVLGAGILLIALAPRQPVLPTPAQKLRLNAAAGPAFRPTGQFPPMVEAFLFGISIALQLRNSRR
jgi:hypothetical protein